MNGHPSEIESIIDIDPADVMGWCDGQPFNTRDAEDIGFRYLKGQSRYSHLGSYNESMDGMTKDNRKQFADDARYAHDVMDGIKRRGRIDEPISVYAAGDGYVLLDGALRLSSIAIIRKGDPSFLPTVQANVFNGTPEEARAEMVICCSDGRRRPLRLVETCEAMVFMSSMGISDHDIAVTQGGAHRIGYVRRLMKIARMIEESPDVEFRICKELADGADEESVVMGLTSSPQAMQNRRKAVAKDPVEAAISRLHKAKDDLSDNLRGCLVLNSANEMSRDMGQTVGNLTMLVRKALLDKKN